MSGAKVGLEGFFTFTAHGGKRGTVQLGSTSPNMILNAGLDRLFSNNSGNMVARCALGTGTTPVTAADTGLASAAPGAVTTTTQTTWPTAPTYVAGPPDYTSNTIVFRFAVGVAVGTFTEVMVGNTAGTAWSRALIVDGSGNPTDIDVLADETLDVAYTLRIYPFQTDATGTVTLEGVSHAYTLRPSSVGAGGAGGWRAFDLLQQNLAGYSGSAGPGAFAATGGTIGPRTGAPSGGTANTSGAPTLTPQAYVNGTFERSFELKADLTQLNLASGITTLQAAIPTGSGTPAAYVQLQFSPNIPKTSAKVLKLNFKVSFARRP